MELKAATKKDRNGIFCLFISCSFWNPMVYVFKPVYVFCKARGYQMVEKQR